MSWKVASQPRTCRTYTHLSDRSSLYGLALKITLHAKAVFLIEQQLSVIPSYHSFIVRLEQRRRVAMGNCLPS